MEVGKILLEEAEGILERCTNRKCKECGKPLMPWNLDVCDECEYGGGKSYVYEDENEDIKIEGIEIISD